MTTENQLPRSKGARPCALDHEQWLRAPEAADVVGLSVHKLDAMRKADRRALEAGEQPSGPPWCERWLGRRVLVSYKRSALVEWAASFWEASGSSPPRSAEEAA